MLAIFNFLNAHNLSIFQPILMILVSKFMVHRALSDQTYLSLGLLPRGGGDSHFLCIRRLGPSICPSPLKNIRIFKHPKKIFEILATPKNNPNSVP